MSPVRSIVRSILVYVTSGEDNAMGENMFKLPMILVLAEAFPEARITWVPGVGGPFFLQKQLAPLVDGRIHEFIADLDIPSDPWGALTYRHPILKRRFDLVIDTQRLVGPTLFLKRIRHGRFVSDNWRYFFSERKPPDGMSRRPKALVDKLLTLASTAAGRRLEPPAALPVPAAFQAEADRLLPPGPVYVGLAPGVGNMTQGRDWPLDRFLAVAAAQAARGRTPVILLGPHEGAWRAQAAEAVPAALIPDLSGQDGGLGGPALTVALAGRLSAALANDAGAGHLLAGGGAPMVSLFGWSKPAKRAPFARSLTVLRAQDFGSEAITAIPIEAVLEALESQIAVGPLRAGPTTSASAAGSA
ncbi:MAG: glycosyltransferase family 9 protein [Caulobacteraceae bacterium]|nr:glycosyltransferase family 9 protein [Caulobacteraceae bacterium]